MQDPFTARLSTPEGQQMFEEVAEEEVTSLATGYGSLSPDEINALLNEADDSNIP